MRQETSIKLSSNLFERSLVSSIAVSLRGPYIPELLVRNREIMENNARCIFPFIRMSLRKCSESLLFLSLASKFLIFEPGTFHTPDKIGVIYIII